MSRFLKYIETIIGNKLLVRLDIGVKKSILETYPERQVSMFLFFDVFFQIISLVGFLPWKSFNTEVSVFCGLLVACVT